MFKMVFFAMKKKIVISDAFPDNWARVNVNVGHTFGCIHACNIQFTL